MNATVEEPNTKTWARLYIDDSQDSVEALRLLDEAGLDMLTIKVGGALGPRLIFGTSVYEDLSSIQEFLRLRQE